MRRPLAVLVAVSVALGALVACGRPGDGGYRLTAWFPRAVALYPESHVKVMGIDVGRVTGITTHDDAIEVTMRIDRDVPLPPDVQASIVPLSLIGERNIVLSPPWHEGLDRIADGATIPLERTHVPVEPDEALQAVTDLAKAVDPSAVAGLVTNGAAALDGKGATLNDALRQGGDLASLLAAQDGTLLKIAADAHVLASTLNSRADALGRLLDDFASVTGELSSEREAITGFLRSLVELTDEGKALLTDYRIQLPADLASVASVALTVQANADSVQQLLQSLDLIGQGVIGAYDPSTGGTLIRFTGSPTVAMGLQTVFDALGLGKVPCADVILKDATC